LIDVRLRDPSRVTLAELAANMKTPVVLMTVDPDTAAYLRQYSFP
jgi:hypothetical protein